MSAARTPYPRLPAAVLQETVQVTPVASPDDVVKTYLLSLTSELLVIQSSTTSLGTSSTDRYSPSLQVLHERLHKGHHSPFPGLDNRGGEGLDRRDEARKAAVASPLDRPLGDFEDLYYAVLATVKAMHESVILRLNNGFIDPNALLLPSSQYTIHLYQEWLAHQWTILNEPSFVLALDIAVRTSLVDDHLCQGLRNQVDAGQITHEEADVARAQLYQSDLFADMPGLSWVGNEHSAMINGRLNEKYRVVFQTEKQAREKQRRWAKRKDRIRKTAPFGPKGPGRRGSGEYRQQRQQVMAEHAQQGIDASPVMTAAQASCSDTKQAEQGYGQAWPSQQVDQTDKRTRSLLGEEVDAWRLYTQQHMSAQRATQSLHHEGGTRRKTSVAGCTQQPTHTTEQATTSPTSPASLRASLRGDVAQFTPRHPPPQSGVQPHVARNQPDARPGASPRETRAQRVTEYQAWLRASASHDAWRVLGQTGPGQPGTSGASMQPPLENTDTLMDVDEGVEGGC